MGPWQMLTFLFSCPPGLSFLPLQSMLQLQARQGSYLLGHTPCPNVFGFVLHFPQPCHALHSESNYRTYCPPYSPSTHSHACVHTLAHTLTHKHDIPRHSTCSAPFCIKKV